MGKSLHDIWIPRRAAEYETERAYMPPVDDPRPLLTHYDNAMLDAVFRAHGTVSADDLAKLDWPTVT